MTAALRVVGDLHKEAQMQMPPDIIGRIFDLPWCSCRAHDLPRYREQSDKMNCGITEEEVVHFRISVLLGI